MHLSYVGVYGIFIYKVICVKGIFFPNMLDQITDFQRKYDPIYDHEFYKIMNRWKRLQIDFIPDIATKEKMIEDMRGLYSTLKHHPALMDRRLQIGGSTPSPIPNNMVETFEKRTRHNQHTQTFDYGRMEHICPVRERWQRLTHALDVDNTEVRIMQSDHGGVCSDLFQPFGVMNSDQYFYTVACDQDMLREENEYNCPECCLAIDSNRYNSRCIQQQSFVMALILKPGWQECDWDFIRINSSCSCAVIPH